MKPSTGSETAGTSASGSWVKMEEEQHGLPTGCSSLGSAYLVLRNNTQSHLFKGTRELLKQWGPRENRSQNCSTAAFPLGAFASSGSRICVKPRVQASSRQGARAGEDWLEQPQPSHRLGRQTQDTWGAWHTWCFPPHDSWQNSEASGCGMGRALKLSKKSEKQSAVDGSLTPTGSGWSVTMEIHKANPWTQLKQC